MRKLKPDRSITGILPVFICVFTSVNVAIWIGPEAGLQVCGGLFVLYALYTLYVLLWTRNSAYLVSLLYLSMGGMWLLTIPRRFANPDDPLNKSLWVLMMLSGGTMFFMFITKRFKWRGREVFELAAAPVDESINGFTARPRPVGQVNANQDEIVAFARFMGSHLIALPYIETGRVVLTPVKFGDEYRQTLKRDYMSETWIAVDFDGNVSTHISHRDYLDYRESLSFDQLCASLGDVFIEFIELFLRGEGVRIIDRMDALGFGLFS